MSLLQRNHWWRLSVVAAAVLGLILPAGATEFHVAPQGNNQNRGTAAQPFATLPRALEASRTAGPGEPRTIIVHAGEYYGMALELTAADRGLTIQAAAGARPNLYGGAQLTGFKPAESPLVAAELPTNAATASDFRMLMVNGHLATRARFPATGQLKHLSEFKVPWMGTYGGGWNRKPTHAELTTVRVRPEDLGPHFDPANAELTFYHEWDESMVGVESFDRAGGVLTLSSETGHPPGAFGNQGYVIWNTRDGLTQPGQWFLDRRQRRVVYWPLPGESNISAAFPTTTAVIRLRGTKEAPVEEVRIVGLALAVADTPLKAGGFGAYAFDGAVTGEHLRRCRFENLTVRAVAGQGLKLSDAQECSITGNELLESGAGGILCPDGAQLQVIGNHIHHIGRIYPSAIGITANGLSNRLEGNFIHDTPYVGLTCDGTAALIASNRLERVMLELHDGAGIYLGGTNQIVRGNVCREIGHWPADRRHAYYMDEMVRHSRLEDNLALQCPSPLHNHLATDNAIINNIFVHDGDMRVAFYRCERHELERNLLVASGRIEVFRPEAVSKWSNNLFFSRTGAVTGSPVKEYSPGEAKPLAVEGVLTAVDPQIRVTENRVDWAADSAAARLGIQPLDAGAAGQAAGVPQGAGQSGSAGASGGRASRAAFWVDALRAEPIAESELLDDLQKARVIYLGEIHSIPRHHQLEAEILEGLLKRGPRLVLAMEQFEYFHQPALDRFNAGALDIAGLVGETSLAKRWSGYTNYLALLEIARREHVPVLALNARAETIRAVGRGGLAALKPELRAQLPKEIVLDDPPYERYLNQTLAVHMAFDPKKLRPVFEAQVARDETMADRLAQFLTGPAGEGRVGLVICGRGHCEFGLGTPARVERRLPGVAQRIVLLSESGDLELTAEERKQAREVEITHEFLRQLKRPPGDYFHMTEPAAQTE